MNQFSRHIRAFAFLAAILTAVPTFGSAALAQCCGDCSTASTAGSSASSSPDNSTSRDVSTYPDIVDVAVSSGKFNTLVAAVKAAGLVDTLKGKGPFTVFAPTDAAFAKLPKGTVGDLLKPENKARLQAILTYHVVPGRLAAADVVKAKSAGTVNGKSLAIDVSKSGVRVGDARVVKTDITAGNGIIHVIDAVLLPPKGKDILETAAEAKTFTTLLAAVKAAGLTDTLKGKGPFTIFAPTDAAFAKLPAGTVESLLEPENRDTLAGILTYHVIPGSIPSSRVVAMKSGKTVNGKSVAFRISDGVVMVDEARIVSTDIDARNGTIHVIDRVILP